MSKLCSGGVQIGPRTNADLLGAFTRVPYGGKELAFSGGGGLENGYLGAMSLGVARMQWCGLSVADQGVSRHEMEQQDDVWQAGRTPYGGCYVVGICDVIVGLWER